jgi:hypothetical protein
VSVMTAKQAYLRIRFQHGRSLLSGPSVRAFILDTLFEIGHSREVAVTLWEAATADPGAKGDRARQAIERATEIRIIVETG